MGLALPWIIVNYYKYKVESVNVDIFGELSAQAARSQKKDQSAIFDEIVDSTDITMNLGF